MGRRLIAVLIAALLTACATTDSGSKPASDPDSDGQNSLNTVPNARGEDEQAPRDKIEPTVVSYPNYRDPLSGFNRAVFAANHYLYRYLMIPAGRAYRWTLPDPAERSIANFFRNLASPVTIVNRLLQLQPAAAGRSLARFGINSTLGVAGLFDPAAAWFDWQADPSGFAETLSGYGSGYGIYLVLPVIGPSSVRDGVGTTVDYFLHPVPYLLDSPESTATMAVDRLQDFAPRADKYLKLHEESEDPYLFFRNLYLQGIQRDIAY